MDKPIYQVNDKRPLFITVLCVIAFIHVGSLIIVGLFGSLNYQSAIEVSGIMGVFMEGAEYIGNQFSLFLSILMLLLTILAFLGIIQVWNMMKTGVWFFSVSMGLFLLLPIITLPIHLWFVLVPNLIVIPILMIMFILNYKNLKSFSDNKAPEIHDNYFD